MLIWAALCVNVHAAQTCAQLCPIWQLLPDHDTPRLGQGHKKIPRWDRVIEWLRNSVKFHFLLSLLYNRMGKGLKKIWIWKLSYHHTGRLDMSRGTYFIIYTFSNRTGRGSGRTSGRSKFQTERGDNVFCFSKNRRFHFGTVDKNVFSDAPSSFER